MANILVALMIETSGSYAPIIEGLNYSAAALATKFPSRIASAQAKQYGGPPAHAADQKAITNMNYSGAWGPKNLGNSDRSDGGSSAAAALSNHSSAFWVFM